MDCEELFVFKNLLPNTKPIYDSSDDISDPDDEDEDYVSPRGYNSIQETFNLTTNILKVNDDQCETKEYENELKSENTNIKSDFMSEKPKERQELSDINEKLVRKRKPTQVKRNKLSTLEIAHYMFMRKIIDESVDRKLTYSQQPKEILDAVEEACYRQFSQFNLDFHRDKVKSYLISCRRNFNRNNGEILVKDKYQSCDLAKRIMMQAYSLEKGIVSILPELPKKQSSRSKQKIPRVYKNKRNSSVKRKTSKSRSDDVTKLEMEPTPMESSDIPWDENCFMKNDDSEMNDKNETIEAEINENNNEESMDQCQNISSRLHKDNRKTNRKSFITKKRKILQSRQKKYPVTEVAHNMFLRKLVDEYVDRKLTYCQQPKALLMAIEEACHRQFSQFNLEFHRNKVKSYLMSCRRSFYRNKEAILVKDKYQSCESAKKVMMQAYFQERDAIIALIQSKTETSNNEPIKQKQKVSGSKLISRKTFWRFFNTNNFDSLHGNEEFLAEQMVEKIWSSDDGHEVMDSILQTMIKNLS